MFAIPDAADLQVVGGAAIGIMADDVFRQGPQQLERIDRPLSIFSWPQRWQASWI